MGSTAGDTPRRKGGMQIETSKGMNIKTTKGPLFDRPKGLQIKTSKGPLIDRHKGPLVETSKGMQIEVTKGPIIKKGIDTYDIDEYARVREYLGLKPHGNNSNAAKKSVTVRSPSPVKSPEPETETPPPETAATPARNPSPVQIVPNKPEVMGDATGSVKRMLLMFEFNSDTTPRSPTSISDYFGS